MKEIRVPCRDNRFVGEFVPFYYCPRSPMLYVVNKGSTGRESGCQKTILHLVSSMAAGIAMGRPWAISDGNAGAAYPSFYGDFQTGMGAIDWKAVQATDWRTVTNQKSVEFLVHKFFPWSGIESIGCYDSRVAKLVQSVLTLSEHRPHVRVQSGWYY